MRKEIKLSFDHDDLIERLGLPKSSVIVSVFTQQFGGPRTYCFMISVEEKELDKYLTKKKK